MSSSFSGLRDAHVHIAHHGWELSLPSLALCASLEECLSRAAEEAQRLSRDQWVVLAAARPQAWPEGRFPTARELDEAVGARPAIVRSFDFHALAASATALALAGIDAATPDPPGGTIDRDLASGEPTGLLLESAMELVDDLRPAPTQQERREHIRRALADFAARGFVEVHDMLSWPWLWRELAAIDREEGLPLRVRLTAPLEAVDEAAAERKAFESDRLTLGGVKIFTDGTLNSRTAWMLEPYADPRPEAPCGVSMLSDEAIERALRAAEERGLDLTAHAIGDAAVRRMLDVVERAQPRTRVRIEHAQFVDEQDAARLVELGVVASMQPCHLLADVEAIEQLVPHRAHRAFPVRDLWEACERAGVDPASRIWFGSDAPVVPPEPADNLQAAVFRRRTGEERAVAPEQAISQEQALALMRPSGG